MEAQSQGLAVVSTRLSGVPELIEDGVNGLLVEADDNHALGEALQRLITELRRPGKRRTRRYAANWESLCRLIIGDE